MKVQRRISWWGKLPARGDFVGRGLPPRWREEWEAWLHRGLALAAGTLGAGGLRERLADFAPWRYLALPASGEVWCGIIVPSHDRVGRAFPLTLAERCSAAPSPDASAARLASLLDAAAEGPEALESAIAALPPHPAEEGTPSPGWPPRPASLWWRLAAGHEAAPRTCAWPPEPELVLELLETQPAEPRSASARDCAS